MQRGPEQPEDTETGEVKRVKHKAQKTSGTRDSSIGSRPQNQVLTINRTFYQLPNKLVETAKSKCWTYGKKNRQLNG